MPHDTMHRALERIAREELELTTLETRGDDAEDYHRLAVWEIETVMERAYLVGREAANADRFARRWYSVGETLFDGSTETVATFDTLQDALRFAVRLGRPCFIDRWRSTGAVPGEGRDDTDETFTAIHYPF